MRALHSPYRGCCCAEDLLAVAQACVDQMVGYRTFIEKGIILPDALHVINHTSQVTEILQEAITSYAENHGEPDAKHQAIASSHVINKMMN